MENFKESAQKQSEHKLVSHQSLTFHRKEKILNEEIPEIEVQNLSIDFGDTLAVDDVSFKIKKGELITLLGPSGSGKTTVLNAIAGLITATSGRIYFRGRNVTKDSPQARKLGFVFQNYALYPHMSTYNNIQFPLKNDHEWQNKKRLEQKRFQFQKNSLIFSENGATSHELNEYEKKLEALLLKPQEIKNSILQKINKLNFKLDNLQGILNNTKSLKNKKLQKLNKEAAHALSVLKKSNDPKRSEKLQKNYRLYKEKILKIKTFYSKEMKLIKDKIANEKKAIQNSNLKKEIKSLAKRLNSETKKLKSEYKNFEKSLVTKYSHSLKKALSPQIKKELDFLNSKILPLKKIMHNAIMEVAQRVDIVKNLPKKPTKLSGGQQQRVAIARAIVKQARLLLMDEPLSNLDAKLRVQTRQWIKEIQEELKITMVFVTHDQEEAMAISDRIICMSTSKIQQIGTPLELYRKPANLFVARFLGVPEMNIFTLDFDLLQEKWSLDNNIFLKANYRFTNNRKKLHLGIRAEDFYEVDQSQAFISVKIKQIEYLGKDIKALTLINLHNQEKEVFVLLRRRSDYQVNQLIHLDYDDSRLHFFDFKTKERLYYENY